MRPQSDDTEVTFRAASMTDTVTALVSDAVKSLPPREGRDLDLLKDVTHCILNAMVPLVTSLVSSHAKSPDLPKRYMEFDNRLDEIEQYTRRDNVVISGMAEAHGENTTQMVIKLAKEVGMDLEEQDISVSHRLGEKHTVRPRPIIAKFVRRDVKVQLLQRKKQLRDTTSYKSVYIDEQLSPLRVKMTRAIRGDDKVHRTWTIDGKIFCSLKSNQQQKIKISTPEDLFTKLDWTEDRLRASGLFMN